MKAGSRIDFQLLLSVLPCLASSHYSSPWPHFADTTQPLTDEAGGYTGGFTCTVAKNLGLGLILARPIAAYITDGVAKVDVLCGFFDPGTPIEIDWALTDVQVFFDCAAHFVRPVKTLISPCVRDGVPHFEIAEHRPP